MVVLEFNNPAALPLKRTPALPRWEGNLTCLPVEFKVQYLAGFHARPSRPSNSLLDDTPKLDQPCRNEDFRGRSGV
jgi:hypothetical protein